MKAHPDVAAVIPALNEAEAIGGVLDAIPPWIRPVVVVDNGSTDDTAIVARRCGATVVAEPRRGYGAACLRGLNALDEPDIVVFLDADRSDEPAELPRLIQPITQGEADLVIGSRVLGSTEPGALSAPQRFGNTLACLLIRWVWGATCTDLGPMRAIRFEALRRLRMSDLGYGWTVQMQARALRHGMCVTEVPVSYRRRIGRSKISGTLRGVLGAGFKILSTIGREAMSERQPVALPASAKSDEAAEAQSASRDGQQTPTAAPSLSIIIPAMNEADHLPETLEAVGPSTGIETIVVDGGSEDDTVRVAESRRARVLHSEPGRAIQMNAGAAAATGQILLFLHADTRLPFGFLDQVRSTLESPGVVAGAFRLAFDDTRPSLRLIEAGANRRSVARQLPYGDQAIFMRRDTFDQLGGFRELPVMEDYDLIRHLRRRGRVAIAPTPVITSARRWIEHGIWRTTLTHQLMLIGWRLGVSADQLARWRRGRSRARPEHENQPAE